MLDALFKPRSVAIIGASANPLSIGHIVIQNLVDHDYKGPIYPINPKTKVIKSFRTYPSIRDVPDEVDLVNISIKNTLVPAVLEECGAKGVKFAIVHTAGFKEVGREGLELERRIVETAHKYGMRIYGPNSQGVQNSDPQVSVYANFTFVPQRPGSISIVAQSGGVGETLKLQLYRIGLGTRMYASFGNEADVSMNEIIEYYGRDEETRVIMVHIETLSDPAGFLETASRITPHKPILALKCGKTSEGVKAVASHTGSMIEQDTMAEALFRKAGVQRFHSQEEMIEAAVALSSQPVPKSENIVIVTNTGGPAIIAVDECMAAGLKLAELSPKTGEALGKLLFTEAIISNPVDVIATVGAEQYGGAVEALLEDPNIDSLILNFVTPPFVDCEAVARRLAEISKTAAKPILCIVLTIEERWGEVIRLIRESGIPVFDYAESASRALAAMIEYGRIRQRTAPEFPEYETDRERAEEIVSRSRGRESFLSQAEVFELLGCYGIAAVRTLPVADGAGAREAARGMTYPLALKVDSAEIVHKSDAGGVRLNIADERELDSAFEELSARFAGKNAGFVLQECLTPGREVIMGLAGNEGLAPTVMFGLGGVFVETLQDVQFRLAPLSRGEAREMVRGIKGYPLLEGTRGEEGVDLEALEELLIRLSRLGADFPEITELDLNPVFAYSAGKGVAAVDARLKLK